MWTTAGLTVSARALKSCGTMRTPALLEAFAVDRPEPSISPTIAITMMTFENVPVCFNCVCFICLPPCVDLDYK